MKTKEQMEIECDDVGFGAGMSDDNIGKFIKNVLERHEENPFTNLDEYYGYLDGVAQMFIQ